MLYNLILAAGKGSRMKSDLPKVLFEVAGKSSIDRVLNAVITAGNDKVLSNQIDSINKASIVDLSQKKTVIVLKHEFDKIDQHIKKLELYNEETVSTCLQNDMDGTAAAVMSGVEVLKNEHINDDDYVLILPSDIPLVSSRLLENFIVTQAQKQIDVSLMVANIDNPYGYGRVIIENFTEDFYDNEEFGDDAESSANDHIRTTLIKKIVEHKDATGLEKQVKLINTGIYLVKFGVLNSLLSKISSDNAQNEYYFTDIVELANNHNLTVSAHILNSHDEIMQISGFNDLIQLSQLREYRQERINTKHRLNGVDIIDSKSVWIDEDVKIGHDTQIVGSAIIKKNVEIGVGCNIGPYTFIREGTKIGNGSKVGGFVEVKNSNVGDNTKIPHLSYVGDATIGNNTNIGAGSIFANYDGVNKHKTQVGSNVKIGSKTVLVAPVKVGDSVYTGAGTLVRQDIEDGALAVSENNMRIFENWTKNNRS